MARVSCRRQDAGGAERLRPRDAAGHVVFEERAVEAERDAEVECCGIGRGVEAPRPERHGCDTIERGLRNRRPESSNANVANRVVALEELDAHGPVTCF